MSTGASVHRVGSARALQLALGAAAGAFLPFLTYAFATPPTYRARTVVTIAATSAAPTPPLAAATTLKSVVVGGSVGADRVEVVFEQPRTLSITVIGPSGERARDDANTIAQRALERMSAALQPDLEHKREAAERERDARAADLASFLEAHPDLPEKRSSAQQDPNFARAIQRLELERAHGQAVIVAPVHTGDVAGGEAIDDRLDREQMRRRLVEIDRELEELRRTASTSPAAGTGAELERRIEAVERARAAAEELERTSPSLQARITSAAELPRHPFRPDRNVVVSIGSVLALLFAMVVGALARRRATPAEAASFESEDGRLVENASHEPGRIVAAPQPAEQPPSRVLPSLPPPVAAADWGSISPPPPPAHTPLPPPISPAPPPPRTPLPTSVSSAPPPAAAPKPRATSSAPPPAAAPATRVASSAPPGSRRSDPLAASSALMAYPLPPDWSHHPNVEPRRRRAWSEGILAGAREQCIVVAVTGLGSVDSEKGQAACELALALSLASWARVLLVEADFRAPCVESLMCVEMPPFKGFSQQLGGRVDRQSNPHWYVLQCNQSLHILADGYDAKPELILSRHFEQAMLELREYYDVIVLHGPSIDNPSECRAVGDVVDLVGVVARDASGIDVRGVSEMFRNRPIEVLAAAAS